MNLFRNPWIVGVLSLVALIVVGYQIIPPLRSRAGVNAESSSTTSTVVADTSDTNNPVSASPPAPVPETTIDRTYIETHFAGWMRAQHRDPFQLINAKFDKDELPLQQLKLKAIWRQTGGSTVVINKGIYKEGDSVEGYTVETINDDEVWLQGSEGRIRLGFTGDGSAPASSHPHSDAPPTAAPRL